MALRSTTTYYYDDKKDVTQTKDPLRNSSYIHTPGFTKRTNERCATFDVP